jgi:hypothetical protein
VICGQSAFDILISTFFLERDLTLECRGVNLFNVEMRRTRSQANGNFPADFMELRVSFFGHHLGFVSAAREKKIVAASSRAFVESIFCNREGDIGVVMVS